MRTVLGELLIDHSSFEDFVAHKHLLYRLLTWDEMAAV